MGKKAMGLIAIVIVVILGLVVTQMFKTTVSPQNLSISQADVSESEIKVKGDIVASAVAYKTYTTEEKDGKLFVKIKGSTLNFTKADGSFDISIENKFGKLNEVYLQGNSAEDTRLIWSQK